MCTMEICFIFYISPSKITGHLDYFVTSYVKQEDKLTYLGVFLLPENMKSFILCLSKEHFPF